MVTGYSRAQIALHWAVALFIFYQLIFSDAMTGAFRAFKDGGTPVVGIGAWSHIIVGSLVLILVLWRLSLRFTRGVPPGPDRDNHMLELAGVAGHWALYVLMIALPITGLLVWFAGMTSLGDLHGGILKVLLWVMIVLHIAAALWHQFIRKDGLMNRMWKPG